MNTSVNTPSATQKLKAYLAGPDVFRPDQALVFEARKELLTTAGIEPLCPMDNAIPDGLSPREKEEAIFRGNCEMLNRADVVIANVNDFRGHCIDDGTAFEVGYATARGLPIFAYRDDLTPMHVAHGKVDANGCAYETFGNAVNLMIDVAVRASGGIVAGDFQEAVGLVVEWRRRRS